MREIWGGLIFLDYSFHFLKVGNLREGKDDMEIKFLGMIFVLLGSFGIGIFYRIRYGNRLHNMQDCERALLILQGEMEYGHTPLMEACEEVSVRIGGIVGSFFAQIAKKLNTHEGALETIWCQTARKVLTKSQMEKEEREEWEKLGGTLGYLDLEMQVSTIQIYVRRLKLRMEQTEKESHERLRMYPVIGAFSGVLICLLLV